MGKDVGKDKTINSEAATRLCNQIARDVNAHKEFLTIRYVLHRDGQRKEALKLALSDLAGHVPAHLLKAFRNSLSYDFDDNDPSAILGAFVQAKNIFFGISSRMQCLALCSINLDEAGTTADVGRIALHQAWHLLNFIDGDVVDETVTTFYPPHNILTHGDDRRALANLKADIFSVAALSFFKQGNLIRSLAHAQSLRALSPVGAEDAMNCLFPVAAEVVELAVGQALLKPMSQKRIIAETLRLTKCVVMTLGDNIDIWREFVASAQMMAWRGYSPSEILESAILSGSNTKTRLFGHILSDNTDIVVKKMPDERHIHSAFTPESYNAILHYNACLSVFAEALTACIENGNADAMRRLARLQNSRLVAGHVLGWCAQALWSAANAFDQEKDMRQKELSARDVFKREQSKMAWDGLNVIAAHVVSCKRKGLSLEKSIILDFCGDDASYTQVCGALRHIGDIESDFSQRKNQMSSANAARPIFQPAASYRKGAIK